MQKRNFILLVIVLVVLGGGLLTYWYFNAPAAPMEPEEGGFLARYNPFKTTPPAATQPPTPADPTPEVTTSGDEVEVNFNKVSSMPVAGYSVFDKERYKIDATGTEFIAAVRYVDRATGNIYQTFADKIEERKFSSTVILRVYEAFFGQRGQTVIMRYLKTDDRTIETFIGALPKEVLGGDMAVQEIKGTYLPENIQDLSVSNDTNKIFYLTSSTDGVVGVLMDLVTGKKTQIFSHAFTEWLSGWGGAKTISLTTKPSAVAQGHMYALDASGKSFVKIFGGYPGLTTLLSPDGKQVLFADSNLGLFVLNRMSGTIDSTGIKTLPEKCVWGKSSLVIYCTAPKSIPTAQYPDSWYKGLVSFSDAVWKIDINTQNTSLLLDPFEVVGEELDGIKLSLDSKEEKLFLVNKKDSFLWMLDLD